MGSAVALLVLDRFGFRHITNRALERQHFSAGARRLNARDPRLRPAPRAGRSDNRFQVRQIGLYQGHGTHRRKDTQSYRVCP